MSMTSFEKMKSDCTQVLVLSVESGVLGNEGFSRLLDEVESADSTRQLEELYRDELFTLHSWITD